MFTANIIKISIGYTQEWMAQKELEEHPNQYPGGYVKQDEFGTRMWYIVRNKTDADYRTIH